MRDWKKKRDQLETFLQEFAVKDHREMAVTRNGSGFKDGRRIIKHLYC